MNQDEKKAKAKQKKKKKKVYYSMLEGLFSNTNKEKFYFVFLVRWKPKKWSYNAAEYKILILIAYQKKKKNSIQKCFVQVLLLDKVENFFNHQQIFYPPKNCYYFTTSSDTSYWYQVHFYVINFTVLGHGLWLYGNHQISTHKCWGYIFPLVCLKKDISCIP